MIKLSQILQVWGIIFLVGVCAQVVIRNEALFLEESITSIADSFDEIIVVDHGSVDESMDILTNLQGRFHNLKVIATGGQVSFAVARNLVALNTKCEWIWQWDADYIAYEKGDDRYLGKLIEELPQFDKDGRNMVLLHTPNFGPTLDTTLSYHPRHGHNGDIKLMRREIFNYVTAQYADTFSAPDKDAVKMVWRNGENSVAHFVQADHAKLIERIIMRDIMISHDRDLHNGKITDDFSSWFSRYTPADIDELINNRLRRMQKSIIPFDFKRWGRHPKLLLNSSHKMPFSINFFGKIVPSRSARSSFPKLWNWMQDAMMARE